METAQALTNDQQALVRLQAMCAEHNVRLFVRGQIRDGYTYLFTTVALSPDGIEFEVKRGDTWRPMYIGVEDYTGELKRIYAYHEELGQIAMPRRRGEIARAARARVADLGVTWV